MHLSDWLQYNPFYNVFYGTASVATTVAAILAIALLTTLWRRNKRASIGLGVGLALATTVAVVLNLSRQQIGQGFANNMASEHYTASVTGIQFLGTPIVMALAALALLGMAGKTAWNTGHTAGNKLTLIAAYALGASLASTFAAQLMQDTYDVGSTYWSNWADLDSWLWAADFVLTCAVLAFGLITVGRRVGKLQIVEMKNMPTTWRAKLRGGNTPTLRTAEATATA